MSDGEQVAAIRMLMAARELLTDPLASDAERKRLADQIGRFINHEPVGPIEQPAPSVGQVRCARCGQFLSATRVEMRLTVCSDCDRSHRR